MPSQAPTDYLKLLDAWLRQIYEGEPDTLPVSLLRRDLPTYLQKARAGDPGASEADRNAYLLAFALFLAYKSEQVRTELLVPLQKRSKAKYPFKQYKQDATLILNRYYGAYRTAEVAYVQEATKSIQRWREIQSTRHLYPYLVYQTIGDNRVRPHHATLEGITRAINDPFWDRYYPPWDWGCRCSVLRTDNPNRIRDPLPKNMPAVDPFFEANVGKTGNVFPRSHPFYKGIPQARKQIIEKVAKRIRT